MPAPLKDGRQASSTCGTASSASGQLIAKIGLNTSLHPDFGAGLCNGASHGPGGVRHALCFTVADNGSNWYISGAPDDRWNNAKLVSELAQVKGSNFEVVRMDGLVVRP